MSERLTNLEGDNAKKTLLLQDLRAELGVQVDRVASLGRKVARLEALITNQSQRVLAKEAPPSKEPPDEVLQNDPKQDASVPQQHRESAARSVFPRCG